MNLSNPLEMLTNLFNTWVMSLCIYDPNRVLYDMLPHDERSDS